MESERGRWVRRLLEKAGLQQALRERKQSIHRKLAKDAAQEDEVRIFTTLDDVASILDLPRDHPKVLAGTAYVLAREDATDADESSLSHGGDLGYPKAEFGSDW